MKYSLRLMYRLGLRGASNRIAHLAQAHGPSWLYAPAMQFTLGE
jgi:hypothetical protein